MRHVLLSFFLLLALATPAHADCTAWQTCNAQWTTWGASAVVAGLPGWWRMAGATFAPCGTITDSSGHGNTATCVGAPTYAVPYSGVGALALNGTSQKATVSNSTSFNSLSSLTISVWIKAPANSMVSFARIVEKGTNTEWALLVNNNSGTDNTVWFQGLSAHLCLGTTVPVADGTWHLVTATNAANVTTLYIDGRPNATSGATCSIGSSTGDITIGEYLGGGNYFNGVIEDLRIYDHALTPSDVSTLFARTTWTALPQTWIQAKHDNDLQGAAGSCDPGGLFVSLGSTPFSMSALNGGYSVYTPACLRDPYIRLYFGTYYLLYSEGMTYLDIASSLSLTSGWTLINHIALGSNSSMGVNVPEFVVDPSGIVHVTVWDAPASAWWEIHPSSSDPSTWGSAWSSRASLTDINGDNLLATENLYITQHNSTYYLLQSLGGNLQLRTSSDVVTGWSAASSNLSIPNYPTADAEGENPIFIGGNLAVSWAQISTIKRPLSYSINSSGSSGSWGQPIQVSPADYYAETTPLTDMACGTAAQYYQPAYSTAPSANLCAVGTPSAVAQNGSNWIWTCTLNSNVANCSASTP